MGKNCYNSTTEQASYSQPQKTENVVDKSSYQSKIPAAAPKKESKIFTAKDRYRRRTTDLSNNAAEKIIITQNYDNEYQNQSQTRENYNDNDKVIKSSPS